MALTANTTGRSNTATGNEALRSNTEGGWNTANGGHALGANTTGIGNTAVGSSALSQNSTGSFNSALGQSAGSRTTGSSNILINNLGEAGESNVLRIGDGTGTGDRELEGAFIHGIRDRSVGNGAVVFVGGSSKLGTKSCGSYQPADVCPLGSSDGPKCDSVPPGSFCEGDGECGTNADLDNCALVDWYLRTE
jgi:hypothetical protein